LRLSLGAEVQLVAVGKQTNETVPISLTLAGTAVQVLIPGRDGVVAAELLRRKAPPAWVTPIDPWLGDDRTRAYVDALSGSDWVAGASMLDPAAASIEIREHLTGGHVMGLVAGRPEGFDAWVAARPDSATARLARGSHGISWGWEIRGGGYAKSVKQDAWAVFHERLREAEGDLFGAVELDPQDPLPWSALITSGRGLSIPKEELILRFEEAIRRSPGLPGAHFGVLQGLCQKWSGSHDEMFAFARERAGSAPDGSRLHGLVATAHMERWMADRDEPARKPYFVDPDVRAELVSHAHRSVLHPAWRDEADTVATLNMFACLLRLAGEQDLAQAVGMRIGRRRTQTPWAFFKDPDGLFMKTQTGAAYQRAT
jgi:hypothetical protein